LRCYLIIMYEFQANTCETLAYEDKWIFCDKFSCIHLCGHFSLHVAVHKLHDLVTNSTLCPGSAAAKIC
jgi:hypothetical protein